MRKKVFYNNLYLDDYKLVVKMPLVKKEEASDIKIKKFDLGKYTYLLTY